MRSSRWFLIAFAGCLSACAALLAQFGVAPVLDRIKVPHDKHTAAKVECLTCHEAIYDATSFADRETFLPKEKVCMQCHREEKEAGNCGKCHTAPSAPRTFATRYPELKMSHSKHIELVKEDCSRCHDALPQPSRPETPIVKMSACLSCHEHQAQYDAGQCSTCHEDLARHPIQPASLLPHRGDFVRQHSDAARSSGATCGTCHEQTFCTDCHNASKAPLVELRRPERVEQRFIHRNDFVSRHMIEARIDQTQCLRCHGTGFCQNCHEQQNLTPTGDNPRNPHPPGWANAGNADGHGKAARADVTSCASCHDQGAASICVNCHKSGGPGGDPHPVGFSSHHPLSEVPKNPMCRTCH
jgi:hypothetical protein